MKSIYIVRHGKAQKFDGGTPDFKRFLTNRGKKDAVKIALRLKEREIIPALIISSPAERALATAQIFAQQLEYHPESICANKCIYEQSYDVLLNIINSVDDNNDSVMIVGHNPSLNDLAVYLMQDFSSYLPTSGLVGISFNVEKWNDVISGQGELILFEYPKKY